MIRLGPAPGARTCSGRSERCVFRIRHGVPDASESHGIVAQGFSVYARALRGSRSADDHSSALFAEDAALLGPRAVIAAPLALEEPKHAAGALNLAVRGGISVRG